MSSTLRPQPHLTPLEARIVRSVFGHPGVVRSELAEHLQASEAGLTAVVRRLVASGALVEVGRAPSSGGRRATQLAVNPRFAHAFAHVIGDGRIYSGLVDSSGKMINRTETASNRHDTARECLERAESSLGDAVARAVAAPGLPDMERKPTAPYLFGPEGLPLGCLVGISTAEALFRHMLATDPPAWDEPVLCVDMADGITGLYAAPAAAYLNVDPTALGVNPALLLKTACADEANRLAASLTGGFGAFRGAYAEPLEALVAAEAAEEPEACALFDRLVDEAARVLATLAQMLRPSRLVFSMKPEIASFIRPHEIRKRLRRRCPGYLSSSMAVSYLEADAWTRVTGTGLAALDMWLESLETTETSPSTVPV